MRIVGVELHHVAEDLDGNTSHAMLMVTLDDGQARILEVELPSPQDLLKLPI